MDQPNQFGSQNDRFTIPGEAFYDCQADVLICSFSCGIESGQVGPLVVSQLLHSLPSRTVARFDIDQIFDYRARRPRLEVDNWVVQGLQMPGCQLDILTDYSGTRFLVLHGMEPDFSWGSFSESLVEVIKRSGVKRAVDLQSAGSSIPHTRTQLINLFTSHKEDLPEGIAKGDRHLLSATFGFQLMFELSNLGVRTDSIMMTVPYYVADTQYPPGAVIALEFIADRMGLDVPIGDLEAAAQSINKDIDSQVELNSEAQLIVKEMEERYDALPQNTAMFTAKSLADSLAQSEGAQIADRIEDFLAQVDQFRLAQEQSKTDPGVKNSFRFSPEPIKNDSKTGRRRSKNTSVSPVKGEVLPDSSAPSAPSSKPSSEPSSNSTSNPDVSPENPAPNGSAQETGQTRAERFAKRHFAEGRRATSRVERHHGEVNPKATSLDPRVGGKHLKPEPGEKEGKATAGAKYSARGSRKKVADEARQKTSFRSYLFPSRKKRKRLDSTGYSTEHLISGLQQNPEDDGGTA